ncbi:MAG: hemerythrin domain-containing protein [Actinomycetota bacterium]|nr:hemerythrin domain-containing protein [Actinomycetota bacterium]
MTTAEASPTGTDVSDMIAVHRVFRDTLGQAMNLIGSLRPGDGDQAVLIVNFYENVLSLLHAHHEGEDQLILPLLRVRCPRQLDVMEQVGMQHRDADVLLAGADRSLVAWAGGTGSASTAATALGALWDSLGSHLDDEEREVLPLCAQHLSPQEWGALPGHVMAAFAGDKVWLVLGLVSERMTAKQRDEMWAHMPPAVLDMWLGFGERAFTDLMAAVGLPSGVVAGEAT